MFRFGGDNKLPGHPGLDARCPHQSGYTIDAHAFPRLYQVHMDARGTIDLPARFMVTLDLSEQAAIIPRSLAFGPVEPIVVTTGRHPQDLAQPGNVMRISLFADKGVLYLSSLAKYAAAFFRISFSSLSRSFSCFSVASSDCSSFLGRPGPENALSPFLASCSFHLYSRFRGIPSSLAISAAGRSDVSINRTTAEIARELGIPRNRLYKWKDQLAAKGDKAFSGSGRPMKRDQSELATLKQENERLKEENEILKKAAAYFAKELK